MKTLWSAIVRGYLAIIAPVADWLVARRVRPNTITTVGTICTCTAGVIFAEGHVSLGGWFLGLTALFDVLDGTVARRTGQTSAFGAFYDSTLDRLADGFLLGGFVVFYATSPVHANKGMVIVVVLALIATFLTSYTNARAEGLGFTARVGVLQRPERITLLSAPQAFFGLAFDGWVLAGILTLLMVTAWITFFQRMSYVHGVTTAMTTVPTTSTSPGE